MEFWKKHKIITHELDNTETAAADLVFVDQLVDDFRDVVPVELRDARDETLRFSNGMKVVTRDMIARLKEELRDHCVTYRDRLTRAIVRSGLSLEEQETLDIELTEIAKLLNPDDPTQCLSSGPPTPRFDGDIVERSEHDGGGPEEPELSSKYAAPGPGKPSAVDERSRNSNTSSDTEGNDESSDYSPKQRKLSHTHMRKKKKQVQQRDPCPPPKNTERKRPANWISCYEVWCGNGFVGNHNWKTNKNGNRTCKRCGRDHDNNV